MRLRLIVQRHCLPPVQLLWTVGDVPLPFTPEPAATISQFLEQVNEVIPLESEDWGLEDYAVEVRGFECLHFSELSRILREDDEVRIRPLQTSDLRFRKISGRHQISVDGKHLIDGVAFGRPFLRRTDRPPIRIPPRKRRRITYDDDSDGILDEHPNTRHLAVHAEPDDPNDITADEGSETDDDYSPDEEEINDLSAELKDIRNDRYSKTGEDDFAVAEDPEEPSNPGGPTGSPRRLTRSRKAGGLCLEGEGMLKLVDENGRPYPGEYNNPLLDLYLHAEDEHQNQPGLQGKTPKKKKRRSNGQKDAERAFEEFSTQPERVSKSISKRSRKGVRFQDGQLETPATMREYQDSHQSDEDLQSSRDMTPNQYESDKENSQPLYEAAGLSVARTHIQPVHISESSESEGEDGDSSYSPTTSASNDSNVGEFASPSASDAKAGASATSSSGSSSKSGQSRTEVTKQAEASHQGENVDVSGARSVVRSSPSLNNRYIKGMTKVSKNQAPYAGTVATQKRNKRRRDSRRLRNLKLRGFLSPTATMADFHRMQNNEVAALEAHDEQQEASGVQAAFEAKRESLLKAIALGGIDITHDVQQENSMTSQDMGNTTMADEGQRDDAKISYIDDRAEILDGPQRQSQADQAPAGKSKDISPVSPDESAITSNNTTGVVGENTNSLGEVGAPPDVGEVAADVLTSPDEVGIPLDGVITPNEIESPPEEIPALSHENAGEIGETPHQNLEPLKRSRLDISSSKRLVFGSLGVRVPKTKEDEANLKAKLMKDVRPSHMSKPGDASDVNNLAISRPTEDDDSWKSKIVLMAVECCKEGVELSTPPFPFYQRWDPQQKKDYHNGYNSRRDKKRKRNAEQYYSKKSRLNASEDNYVYSASASFSIEGSAAGEFISPLQEQQDQTVSREENEQDENARNEQDENARNEQDENARNEQDENARNEQDENVRNEQTQGEADASAPSSADNAGIQDLPSLPKNMSTCPSLTELMTMPGTIIAFKQLIMSEETNWQPRISHYRTAIVNSVADDGTLRMTLAQRDQPNKEEIYDQHTGERVYSKFEMPGFDDQNAEDPGVVEISFSELIEPKLVQQAKLQSTEHQPLVRAAEHSPSDMDTAMENNFQSSPDGPKQMDPELPGAKSNEGKIAGANEGVRQEIFDLIKEAGWRSSVRSLNDDEQRSEETPPISHNKDHREEENPKQCLPEQSIMFDSSPPGERSWEPPNRRSSERSLTNSPSLPQSQHGFEIAETLQAQRKTVPNTPTKNPLGNGDDTIDIKEEDYDEGPVLGEHQPQIEADHQMSSQELSSQNPLLESVSRPVQDNDQNAKLISSPPRPTSPDDASSDNEFPTLENVFSQIKSSQAISCQGRSSFEPRLSDDDLTYMAKSSFESTTTKGEDSQRGGAQSSECSGKYDRSQKQTLFKWEDSDEGDQTTPRPSQVSIQAQIVDLTLPSDSTDAPNDSDYVDDGSQLPVGPGWVRKTRASSSRLSPVRPAERRSTMTRSRSVY